jgi:uncharacterized protein YjbI with pentapeptide repeats
MRRLSPEIFPVAIDMSGVDLNACKLRLTAFSETRLDFVRLSDADLTASIFELCSLRGAKANGVDWSACRIEETTFENADVSDGEFRNALIGRGNIGLPSRANLKGAIWIESARVRPDVAQRLSIRESLE